MIQKQDKETDKIIKIFHIASIVFQLTGFGIGYYYAKYNQVEETLYGMGLFGFGMLLYIIQFFMRKYKG